MPTEATIKDLLDSLNYGQRYSEKEIINSIRNKFGVPPNRNLEQALQGESLDRVLEAIVQQLRPFARMISDIYSFLTEASIYVGGNLEVLVPLSQAKALRINPIDFARYERDIVEKTQSFDVDFQLLPANGKWQDFHNGYWSPRCYLQNRSGESIQPCDICSPEEQIANFMDLTRYYEALVRAASEQLQLPSEERLSLPGCLSWDDILWQWEVCVDRNRSDSSPEHCFLENEYSRSFVNDALDEFRKASRPGTIEVEDIRKFLALPYWKHRWQFYEVWFVTVVLKSYGLSKIHLEIESKTGIWRLNVGSKILKPIATSSCGANGYINFYYQFEGVPPAPMFSNSPDRPEMLVQYDDSSNVHNLLVAEIKAQQKRGFGLQAMKGALFSLLEWEARAIVGASYYDLGSGQHAPSKNLPGTQLIFADNCQPRSESARNLRHQLEEFWRVQRTEFCR